MPTSVLTENIPLSFSGTDARVYALVPGKTGLVFLQSLQTVSVSIFREKSPVRALGYTNVKGHTRGPRVIAGSLVATILADHPLRDLFDEYKYDFSYDAGFGGPKKGGTNLMFPDEIPPFHLIITYASELGHRASFAVIGVDLVSDGIVTSVEDMITENTYQYKARDIIVFHQDEDFDLERQPELDEAVSTVASVVTDENVVITKTTSGRTARNQYSFGVGDNPYSKYRG